MTQILIPIVSALLVFLFFGIVLHLTKYKKRNDQNASGGCCSGSDCCEAQKEAGHDCVCHPPEEKKH
ncbi:MAG: hypothetical protein KAW12_28470 [Candidatus Aminicenantes bacterium]|nr:hypothetical protein [Candidatus Aminicenantes bacterium]